jgi:hypothetical protein
MLVGVWVAASAALVRVGIGVGERGGRPPVGVGEEGRAVAVASTDIGAAASEASRAGRSPAIAAGAGAIAT